MSEREEVHLESGFVLHLRPYRNTSLIIDCLTAQYGRQALVAQGARRPDARRRALLQPFHRVRLSWIRRGEMGRLTQVESEEPQFEFGGENLFAAYYLNELLIRLVPRGDHNASILSCYSSCLSRLAGSGSVARALRLFELELIEALGFGIDLDHDFRTGEPIDPKRRYVFEHESGVTAITAQATMNAYDGKHLISLRLRELEDDASLRTAKHLLGGILLSHLGDRPLKTRAVMQDLLNRGFTS
jgi:DNA repair protein RecO (recombination protein O)